MLSKAQIKHIRSLTLQKNRDTYNQFVAEGEKIAHEWLKDPTPITTIVATQEWVDANTTHIARHQEAALHIVEENILASISSLKTTNKVLLVAPLPVKKQNLPIDEWTIALDGIQDPGNMGSIIRVADWFGIKNIVCSQDCVDAYNPKVIQAGMGSHLRVNIYETELQDYLGNLQIPVLAAVLDGDNLYQAPRKDKAVLLIGNEGKGIRKNLVDLAQYKLTIPAKGKAESLNAAISAGILCSHLVPV